MHWKKTKNNKNSRGSKNSCQMRTKICVYISRFGMWISVYWSATPAIIAVSRVSMALCNTHIRSSTNFLPKADIQNFFSSSFISYDSEWFFSFIFNEHTLREEWRHSHRFLFTSMQCNALFSLLSLQARYFTLPQIGIFQFINMQFAFDLFRHARSPISNWTSTFMNWMNKKSEIQETAKWIIGGDGDDIDDDTYKEPPTKTTPKMDIQ